MIIHLCKDTLEALWPLVTPGLKRPLENTTLGEFWDLDSLYKQIQEEKLFGFYQEFSGYAGVYSIASTPKAKQVYFFWSGVDEEAEGPIDYGEVNRHLLKVAEVFKCTHILCEGRVGWKKVLEPLGYETDGSLYLKRII